MMFEELESALLEVEYEMQVKADIAKAYAALKIAHAQKQIKDIAYEANKLELDDMCDELRRGHMKIANDYDVETVYAVIARINRTINYVEPALTPLFQSPAIWEVKTPTVMPTYEFKQSNTPYESDKVLHIATPDPKDCKDVPKDEDDDGFNVIMGKRWTYKPKPKPAVAEITRTYEITHQHNVPKEVFFHNMSMAIQRFCANYSCTFDGYSIKYGYCNINFTHMTKDIGSKKLRYTQQQGVLLVDYKYSSTDLKNNTKEVHDAIESALFEFHKALNLYAECDYLCPY